MAKFTLLRQLRLFIRMDNDFRYPLLGEKLPVSVGCRTSLGQSVYIYPQDGYSFFTSSEVERIICIAKSLQMHYAIYSDGNNPIIKVSCYNC